MWVKGGWIGRVCTDNWLSKLVRASKYAKKKGNDFVFRRVLFGIKCLVALVNILKAHSGIDITFGISKTCSFDMHCNIFIISTNFNA